MLTFPFSGYSALEGFMRYSFVILFNPFFSEGTDLRDIVKQI